MRAKTNVLPSRLEVRLLRLPSSSSTSLRVCARGVDLSMWRGTSVLTGDILAGRFDTCQQSGIAPSRLYLPCCWDSVQLLEWTEIGEQVVLGPCLRVFDYAGLRENL